MPERLQLPTDRPYPPAADQRGASVRVDWPVELQQRMRDLARQHNATTFMVMQAALAVLLSRISASSDVAVGFPIAGRKDPALDGLVGFFVNTLVLRVDVSGDPTASELLSQVRRRSLSAYEHQDVPFEALVERLNPTRSLNHHPLVQVMLAWQNLPEHVARIPKRRSRWVTSRSPSCRWTPTPLAWTCPSRWQNSSTENGESRRDPRVGGVPHRCVRHRQH